MAGGQYDDQLVEIVLLDLPLDLLQRSREHHDGMQRELALVAQSETDPPAQLRRLADELRERFAPFTGPVEERIEQAVAAGERAIDLVYRVPTSVSDSSRRLHALLEAVDDYCRAGAMLTLATPTELADFRHWFLKQFIDQPAGARPVSWPDWRARPPSDREDAP